MTEDPATMLSLDDQLWTALTGVADRVAARNAIPLVVPVKEIMAAVHAVYADVPRIPAPDPKLSTPFETLRWDEPQKYSPHTVLEDLPSYAALSVTEGSVLIEACPNEDHSRAVVVTLPPDTARDFFLNGLAACLVAERHEHERLRKMAMQPLDLSAIPAEVFKQGRLADQQD